MSGGAFLNIIYSLPSNLNSDWAPLTKKPGIQAEIRCLSLGTIVLSWSLDPVSCELGLPPSKTPRLGRDLGTRKRPVLPYVRFGDLPKSLGSFCRTKSHATQVPPTFPKKQCNFECERSTCNFFWNSINQEFGLSMFGLNGTRLRWLPASAAPSRWHRHRAPTDSGHPGVPLATARPNLRGAIISVNFAVVGSIPTFLLPPLEQRPVICIQIRFQILTTFWPGLTDSNLFSCWLVPCLCDSVWDLSAI